METRHSKVEQVKIAQNTRLLFKPLSEDAWSNHSKILSAICLRVGGVETAYLSSCKLPTEEHARNVIVVGAMDGQCLSSLGKALFQMLQGFEFRGQPVDVLPMKAASIPAAVLQTGLRVA